MNRNPTNRGEHSKKWRQSGVIYLWKYRNGGKNYAGWHFSATREGAESLLEGIHYILTDVKLTDILVTPTPPTDDLIKTVRFPVEAKDVITPKLWRLGINRDTSDDQFWESLLVDQMLTLVLSEHHLREVGIALQDLLKGMGDFGHGARTKSRRRWKRVEGSSIAFWWLADLPPRERLR